MTRISHTDPTAVESLPPEVRAKLDHCRRCIRETEGPLDLLALDLYAPVSVDTDPSGDVASYVCDVGHRWERGFTTVSTPEGEPR